MTKISNQYSLTNILTADLANSRLGINNVSPTVALDVTGAGKFSSSVTSNDLLLTAGTLFGAGNTGFSNRLSDTTLYLQMPATGFTITDNALNTKFNITSAGAATFSSSLTVNGFINLGSSAVFPTVGLLNRTSDTTLYLKAAASGFSLLDNSQNGMYQATPTSHIWSISNSEKMRINSVGNVGIGTTTPDQILSVRKTSAGAETIALSLQNISQNPGTAVSMVFCPHENSSTPEPLAKISAIRSATSFAPTDLAFYTYGTGGLTEKMRIGSIGFTASTRTASDSESKTFMNTLNVTCGLIPVPAGTTLYLYSRDSSTNYRALLTSSTYFTGQHGNKPVDLDLKNNVENYIGMIVSSAGTYYSVNPITKEVTTGKDAISISEALPEIKLTNIDKDKSVWGVVTNVKNDNYNTDGTVETDNNTEWGDRLGSNVIRINGLGEGAIWVTNINGNIENGDFICSSLIAGYGRKQDDDILRNYTVAKITMDCDFDLNNNNLYKCEEFEFEGEIYKKAFVGCTYHCS
jgi:hypothetical protein